MKNNAKNEHVIEVGAMVFRCGLMKPEKWEEISGEKVDPMEYVAVGFLETSINSSKTFSKMGMFKETRLEVYHWLKLESEGIWYE